MSSLYTQINQEAARQKQQVERTRTTEDAQISKDQSADSPASKSVVSNKSKKNRSTARANAQPNDRTVNRTTERPEGQGKASQKPITQNPQSSTLIEEMKSQSKPVHRPTERSSFEIYSDQKETIKRTQYQYEKRTGKQLSKSRIIREALDIYLAQLAEE